MPTTRTSPTASLADVSATIGLSSNGDTVRLPASQSATWTAQLALTKGITLDFNGCTITRNLVSGTALIDMDIPAGFTDRITGGTFSGGATLNVNGPPTYLNVFGSTAGNFRIDHCTFNDADGDTHCRFWSGIKGLVDNCTFNCTQNVTEVLQNIAYGPGVTTGWGLAVTPGSDNAVYVETCSFNMDIGASAGANSAMQNYNGSRTVFRYNTLRNCNFDNHGTFGEVGGRWWEIYENTWICSQPLSRCIQLRAGSGVVFNNRINNVPPNPTGNRGIDLYTDEATTPYPRPYQVGRGMNQTLDPAYIWNNTNPDGQGGMQVGAQDPPIQLGRDYYATAKSAYTSLQYPHPLTGAAPLSVGLITTITLANQYRRYM